MSGKILSRRLAAYRSP